MNADRVNGLPLKTDAYPHRYWLFWQRLTLLVTLVLLAALIGWIVFQFSLPKPNHILAGSVEDYGDGLAPRLFWDQGTPFYVLQTGGELIALAANSKRVKPCLIRWEAERERFVDPCWGTRFLPNGVYEDGPPWEMEHLPVQILEGEIWVETGYR